MLKLPLQSLNYFFFLPFHQQHKQCYGVGAGRTEMILFLNTMEQEHSSEQEEERTEVFFSPSNKQTQLGRRTQVRASQYHLTKTTAKRTRAVRHGRRQRTPASGVERCAQVGRSNVISAPCGATEPAQNCLKKH